MWKAAMGFVARIFRSVTQPVEEVVTPTSPLVSEEENAEPSGVVLKFRSKASIEYKDMQRKRKDFRQFKKFGQ